LLKNNTFKINDFSKEKLFYQYFYQTNNDIDYYNKNKIKYIKNNINEIYQNKNFEIGVTLFNLMYFNHITNDVIIDFPDNIPEFPIYSTELIQFLKNILIKDFKNNYFILIENVCKLLNIDPKIHTSHIIKKLKPNQYIFN
jgi:hypothetical protein